VALLDADSEGAEAENNAKDKSNERRKLKPCYFATLNQFPDIRQIMENKSLDKAVHSLSLWNKVLLKNATVAQLVKNCPLLREPEESLPHLRQLVTGPYHEPV
jgi:hypothetical protein